MRHSRPLRQLSPAAVLAAIGYAVLPAWAGLIATVALGLALVRAQSDTQAVHWPWPPLRELLGA